MAPHTMLRFNPRGNNQSHREKMASNQLHHLDTNLKKCYQFDLDWNLLPDRLQQVRCYLSKHFTNESHSFAFAS